MNLVKKIALGTMIFALLLGVVTLPEKEASAKSVSKRSTVVTLSGKNKMAGQRVSIRSNEEVLIKIKILDVKGKMTEKWRRNAYFGTFLSDFGTGSYWMGEFPRLRLSKNAFKKGNVIKVDDDEPLLGEGGVDWDLPDGITMLKMQITYYTKSGKAGINYVKTTYNKSAT